jgi:hypothetical protein
MAKSDSGLVFSPGPKRSTVAVASALGGCLTGVAGIVILRGSPYANVPTAKTAMLWVIIPLAGLCWLILCCKLRLALARGCAFAAGLVMFAVWASSAQEPIVLGNVILGATGDLDLITFGALLLTMMALIDLSVHAASTPKWFVTLWLFIFVGTVSLTDYLPGFARSKLELTVAALTLMTLFSFVWTILIEVVLYSADEIRGLVVGRTRPATGDVNVAEK